LPHIRYDEKTTINGSFNNDEKLDLLFAYMAKHTKSRDTKERKSPPNEFEYCFQHGRCKHKSIDCRDKGPSHKDHATFTNKMGGK
jgi:hypothetical protein